MTTSSPAPAGGSLRLDIENDGHAREQWERAAAAVLRKARRLSDEDPDSLVWEKLARTTLDGIRVTPLGLPSDLDGLATSGRPARSGPWDVRTYVPAGDAGTQRAEAIGDLEGGATSVWLKAGPGTDFAAALDGVRLDLAPVVLDADEDPLDTARAFLAHAAGTTLHPQTNLGLDAAEASAEGAALAREAGVLGFVVDATPVHDAGASEAQELGFALAVAAGYLRSLELGGVAVDDAAALVEFRFAATDEQFLTIAKVRAARRLWARMLELSGAGSVEQRQHVVTSRPMMSRFDPYANMLRTTVAAFGAGVGGADAVTVLPFDSPLGRPDAFGRRIARNTSTLLVAESHVAAVADPAGGAFAVEKLTDDVAVAAWAELGRIEAEGVDALHARIAEVAATRAAQVAKRSRPITGLSEFPNLAETRPERAPYDDWAGVRPYGEAFEALRDEPAATPVFLATMGTVAEHTARATFATNLFAAGGVAVEVGGVSSGPPDVVAAYGGQPVVCLAGTDAAYAEWGADLATALREAGARRVILAGKPGDRTVAADAVDDSCALGVDALAFLTRTREALS
ncbi:MAG: methylmalonyl-CoA mutase family protein [Nocardioidaceae bacterium]